MAPTISKISSILTLSLLIQGCAATGHALPNMERQITLYKGCPEVEGICKKTKAETKAEIVAALNSLPAGQVSEWLEKNINGVSIKYLPAKSKEFAKYVSMPAEDLGVILKFINDLKRTYLGNF